MIVYLGAGVLLGLSAGISPGPLLALVISHSIRYGPREGVRVAAAPLVTDLPIILLSTFVLSRFAGHGKALGAVSLAGAAVLLHMAYGTFRAGEPSAAAPAEAPRSLLRGAAVNALSPHPWLFWITVGGPTILKGSAAGLLPPVLFVGSFTACLVGSKVAVAYLVSHPAWGFTGRRYRLVMGALGILLLLFALLLARDGARLLGWTG